MIFQKRGLWKISGHAQKYATLEEAESALAKIQSKIAMIEAKEMEKVIEEEKKELAREQERQEKLKQLSEDSTPYEKMIAKNICLICDLEPCECFTYTTKMEVGQSEDTKSFSS
jgi:hypothetical protein